MALPQYVTNPRYVTNQQNTPNFEELSKQQLTGLLSALLQQPSMRSYTPYGEQNAVRPEARMQSFNPYREHENVVRPSATVAQHENVLRPDALRGPMQTVARPGAPMQPTTPYGEQNAVRPEARMRSYTPYGEQNAVRPEARMQSFNPSRGLLSALQSQPLQSMPGGERVGGNDMAAFLKIMNMMLGSGTQR